MEFLSQFYMNWPASGRKLPIDSGEFLTTSFIQRARWQDIANFIEEEAL